MYRGLKIRTTAGHVWEWRRHAYIVNKHGASVRVEAWSRPCRYCGAEFEALQKLPARVGKAFRRYSQRLNPKVPRERVYQLPKRFGTLELVNCPAHRGMHGSAADDLFPPLEVTP